jgi:1-deoxy-D-xylulose-5-phosphate synthase
MSDHLRMSTFPLLSTIDDPAVLRRMDRKQLPALAHELRAFIVQSVSATGGHFSSNLGTVELSIALHYVFNTPDDRLVWDVGHQCYGHKILTGRRERMPTLRQRGGIAGFPVRKESVYDTFGTAHSSTSISAALGMAAAAQATGSERKVVAIIGDGAMTAGMAFEALNNATSHGIGKNLIVILNDNEMSISEPVGALNNYLARLMTSRLFTGVRGWGKKVLAYTPTFEEIAKRTEEHAKGMVLPSTMFEEFGLQYFGPIDGHNVDLLVTTLSGLRNVEGPTFLHIVTRKGQGYKLAEDDPINYHGIPTKFDPQIGLVKASSAPKPSYTQIFGEWLCDMAAADARVVAITPAMREGSGLVKYSQLYPNRYFDVGIAEQHAVTFAAGMAADGMKPVVAIYSTFLQRAYDQLIHDVALQNLPVLFAIDRGGLVGQDGPTHHGAFDLSYLRCVPNLTVMTPADENESRQMLYTAHTLDSPTAVRYPRGSGPGVAIEKAMQALPVGRAELRRPSGKPDPVSGQRVAFLSFGSMLQPALFAADELQASVVNMRFVKPIDEAMILQMATSHDLIVTLEENVLQGGAGSAVAEVLAAHGIAIRVLHLGLPDQFVEHGDPGLLLAECRLNGPGVLRSVREFLNKISGRAMAA